MTDRQKKNRIKKEFKLIDEYMNEPLLKEAIVYINWKKSRNWGNNPSLDMNFEDVNGDKFENTTTYKCSGCGYDKESTVFANMLNDIFTNILIKNIDKILSFDKVPYGIFIKDGHLPSFTAGVGMNCYYSIFEFLGYKLENINSGSDYDTYTITKLN